MNKGNLKLKMNIPLTIAKFILALILVTFIEKSFAQQSLWSREAQSVLKPSSKSGWIEFKDETNISPQKLFADYKSLFGLGADDEMRLFKKKNDNIGMTHYRYQQYYKGIAIKGADYIVHSKDGRVVSANGKIISGVSADVSPSVTEENGLSEALKAVRSTKYLWLNQRAENRLKEKRKSKDATYYPQGELMFVNPAKEKGTAEFVLCWKYDINVEDGLSKTVFINALNGSLAKTIALDINCNSGTATTAFNGTQTISTKIDNGNYIMYEDCGSPEIHVMNANYEIDQSFVTEFTNVNNNWNSLFDQAPAQTLFGLHQAVSFYWYTFTRDSYDDSGGDLDAYNNQKFEDDSGNIYPNNAMWHNWGSYLSFGPGDDVFSKTDDWNADDIVGHEFTHGVTQDEAGLDYEDESGALNESFSDIFGEMVERWVEGSCDWLEGADRSPGYIRNFANPKDKGHPDTYLGTNWYSGTVDHGGVHTNSGVQNHCFYLLSVGGTGINDHGDSYSFTGIGIDAAAAIAYRALCVYLSSGSEYLDAREGWIRAAIDLYGSCSNEAIQTGKAWYAVGVGANSDQYYNEICGTYPQGSSAFLQAINTLTGAESCINTITPSAFSVTYSASDMVVLYPGFTAQSGSHFMAYVEPCAITMYRAVSPPPVDHPVESKIVSEKLSASTTNSGNSFLISPSPFTDQLKFSFSLADAGIITINIYDLLGKKVMEEMKHDGLKGQNEIIINTSQLKPGAYFAEFKNSSNKSVQKIVKTK